MSNITVRFMQSLRKPWENMVAAGIRVSLKATCNGRMR